MKFDINNKTYGIGSNQTGGRYAIVSELCDDIKSDFIEKVGLEFYNAKVYKRKTVHIGGFPVDGGNNPIYTTMLEWIRSQALVINPYINKSNMGFSIQIGSKKYNMAVNLKDINNGSINKYWHHSNLVSTKPAREKLGNEFCRYLAEKTYKKLTEVEKNEQINIRTYK